MKSICVRVVSFVALSLAFASSAAAQSATIRLAWDANSEPDLAGYVLRYGTSPGVYTASVDVRKVTTFTVTGLVAGRTYYFVAQAYNTSGMYSANSTPEVSGIANDPVPSIPSKVVSPAAGTTLNSFSQTFTWDAGSNVTGYWLDVGTTPGGYDLFQGYVGTWRSWTVNGIPLNGGTVWVRLRSLINGTYQISEHQFPTASAAARLISPAIGSTLTGSSATFAWDAGIGAQFFWVNVGSSQGGYEYYSNYVGTFRTLTVTGLPVDGRTIWVRLMSYINGQYRSVDHRFVAATAGPARLTSPSPGSVLTGAKQTFRWTHGVGATGYWVNVGSTQGGYEYYSNFIGLYDNLTVSGLPTNGSPVWVRLMSLINGSYQALDYQFTAMSAVPARITRPAAGEMLEGAKQTFEWTEAIGATGYWVNIGSAPGGYDYYSNFIGNYRTLTVAGLPTDGRPIYVQLMSLINGQYQSVHHEFKAAVPGPARVIRPKANAVLDGATQTFTWTEGTRATGYWVNIGSTQGGYEFYSNFVGPWQSLTVNNLPVDGRDIWVRVMSLIDGQYQFTDQRFVAASPRPSRLTGPAAGTVLASPTQTFTWDAGVGVTGHWVDVGTSQGGYELYSNYLGLGQSLTVNNLPITGGPIWVRLYSMIGGVWVTIDYQFSTQ